MIRLTASAANELKRLMAERDLEGALVRLGVESGGCSGLRYTMDFDREERDADVVFEQEGLRLACEPDALHLLDGLTVDYSGRLMGGGFRFENPNASRSCGCGSSFRA